MSSLNIQWTRGKPFGILSLLTGFAILTQIPMIYHAQMVIHVLKSSYLPAYVVIIIAAVFIITNAEMAFYEAFLIRLRSYDLKDYRAPFLSSTVVSVLYIAVYFIIFAIANGLELFGLQDPIAQYGICQMISLIIVMVMAFWYNKRQIKVLESL